MVQFFAAKWEFPPQFLWRAAISGLVAGLAYAVAEGLFLVALPALVQASDIYQPIHFGVTALLFAVYPVLGALLSVCLAGGWALLAVRANKAAMLPELASASGPMAVLLSVTAALWLQGSDSRLGVVAVVAGGMCLGAAALSVWSPDSWRWLSPVRNIWVAAMVPFGMAFLPGLVAPHRSFLGRLAIVLTYAAVVLGLAYWKERRRREPAPAGKTGFVPALAATALLLAAGAAIDRGLYIRAPRPLTSADAGKRPNVLLIVLDTVRADHLSLYGYERDTTPNLKKLAAEATVYSRAASTADWTLPSHASMFTGLYPTEHGAYCDVKDRYFPKLPDAPETVAERLRDEGYVTLGVVANVTMLLRNFNIHQGFQYYATRLPASPLYAGPSSYGVRKLLLALVQKYSEPAPNPDMYVTASLITKEVSTLISQVLELGKPWFLFANYMDAHTPYNPPPPYATRYSAQPAMPFKKFDELTNEVLQLKRAIPNDVLDPIVAKYDGGIAYIDDQIGVLCDRLRQLGVYDDTMIIVTADHGEAFGDRMLVQHGISVYEDQIHVPLIVKWPRGVTRPADPLPVSAVDLKPTILEVAGLKPGAHVSGRSLLKNHESGEIRIAETYPCSEFTNLHPRFQRVERALLQGPWKLIASTTGGRELYNLESDPLERRNLYSSNTVFGKTLEAQLDAWRKGSAKIRPQSVPAALSQEDRERLKSLGYVQ